MYDAITTTQRPLAWRFVLAAFGITYLLGIPAYVLLQAAQEALGTNVPLINDRVMAFGPTLAALAVVRLRLGPSALTALLKGLVRWKTGLKIYIFVLLFPPAAQLFVLWARGSIGWGEQLVWSFALAFPPQLLTAALLGGGLGEEVGWRGVMAPAVSGQTTPAKAAAIVGLAWFAWHLPAYFLTSKAESDPILPFLIVCLAASFVLAHLYFHSGRVLWVPVLLHGSLNASWYTLEEVAPLLVGGAAFQPLNDYAVAAIWCLAAVLVPRVFPVSKDGSSCSHPNVVDEQGLSSQAES